MCVLLSATLTPAVFSSVLPGQSFSLGGERRDRKKTTTLTAISNSDSMKLSFKGKKNNRRKKTKQDHSIKFDNNNHRFDVPVKAYFHSICTLLDLLSILNIHYTLPPSSACLSPSLPSSFPLVVSAIIIPLFFEVFVKNKIQGPTNNPQTCEYTLLLSIGGPTWSPTAGTLSL